MRIETTETMNIIYPSAGKYIYWQETWVPYIAAPLTTDINALFAQCVEHTPEQRAAIEEELRLQEEATEEDYVAALEVLGVSE